MYVFKIIYRTHNWGTQIHIWGNIYIFSFVIGLKFTVCHKDTKLNDILYIYDSLHFKNLLKVTLIIFYVNILSSSFLILFYNKETSAPWRKD